MSDIAELVNRARYGGACDERVEAFGLIARRFQDMACGYAYSILGDFHLAEDAAQEAFVAAFRQLGELRQPEAFAGWFRRIVWSACGRFTRRSQVATTPLEAAAERLSQEDQPGDAVEKAEMRDAVLRAINDLPPPDREATTLFYINGYSQQEVADFLEVPVTTVKNRLSASRGRLKERMLNMVKDTLHENAPDERFSQAVVEGLLTRANLLRIADHPVRKVLDAIRRELSEYEFVDAEEIVPTPARALQDSLAVAYRVDRDRVLSYETTISVLRAATGRQPPVRLIAAGRSFRAVNEDAWHRKAFHQMDVLCIDRGVTLDACMALVRRAARAALGHREVELSGVVNVMSYSRGYRLVTANTPSGPIPIGGFGLLEPEALLDLGLDPATVSGFAVDFGLERLAMLAFNIDDAAKLSQPPYVP